MFYFRMSRLTLFLCKLTFFFSCVLDTLSCIVLGGKAIIPPGFPLFSFVWWFARIEVTTVTLALALTGVSLLFLFLSLCYRGIYRRHNSSRQLPSPYIEG